MCYNNYIEFERRQKMLIEKQELLKSIEDLPEEIVLQLLDYMEYLKFNYIVNQAPKELIIKDKEDLKKKLEAGIESTEKGEVFSLEEVLEEVKKI